MSVKVRRARRLLLVGALSAVVGCGGTDAKGDAAAGDTVPATPAAPEDTAVSPDAALTLADLDTYERGSRLEVAMLEAVVARLDEARSGTDTLSAVTAALPDRTQAAAAERLGVPLARYRMVFDEIDQALAARQMSESPMLKEMRNIDTTGLTAEERAQLGENLAQMEEAWGDPFRHLTPELAEALQRKAPDLDALRARLIALRAKAAGRKAR